MQIPPRARQRAGAPGHPALHLRRLSPFDVFDALREQFEQVWGIVEDDVKGDGNGLKVSVYGGGRDDTRRQDASTRTASPAGP